MFCKGNILRKALNMEHTRNMKYDFILRLYFSKCYG